MFKGDFDKETSDNIARMVMENTLRDSGLGNKGKVLFHVAVELLQNISRHGVQISGKTVGTLIVKFKDDQFEILTKNYIEPANKSGVEILLEDLHKLKQEELSTLYKKRLKEGVMNNTNNAGVGLIDILRNTRGNLKYNFSEKENGLELTISATIDL